MDSKRVIGRLLAGTVLAALVVSGAVAWRVCPRPFSGHLHASVPAIDLEGGRFVARAPADVLLAEVADFPDQLPAYLHVNDLRTRTGLDPARVLLTATPARAGQGPVYRIVLALDTDLLTTLPVLADFEGRRIIPGYSLRYGSRQELAQLEAQSHTFDVVYTVPLDERLESLDPAALRLPLRTFLLFKSRTDRRVRDLLGPPPPPSPPTRPTSSPATSWPSPASTTCRSTSSSASVPWRTTTCRSSATSTTASGSAAPSPATSWSNAAATVSSCATTPWASGRSPAKPCAASTGST